MTTRRGSTPLLVARRPSRHSSSRGSTSTKATSSNLSKLLSLHSHSLTAARTMRCLQPAMALSQLPILVSTLTIHSNSNHRSTILCKLHHSETSCSFQRITFALHTSCSLSAQDVRALAVLSCAAFAEATSLCCIRRTGAACHSSGSRAGPGSCREADGREEAGRHHRVQATAEP